LGPITKRGARAPHVTGDSLFRRAQDVLVFYVHSQTRHVTNSRRNTAVHVCGTYHMYQYEVPASWPPVSYYAGPGLFAHGNARDSERRSPNSQHNKRPSGHPDILRGQGGQIGTDRQGPYNYPIYKPRYACGQGARGGRRGRPSPFVRSGQPPPTPLHPTLDTTFLMSSPCQGNLSHTQQPAAPATPRSAGPMRLRESRVRMCHGSNPGFCFLLLPHAHHQGALYVAVAPRPSLTSYRPDGGIRFDPQRVIPPHAPSALAVRNQ
jgi:hypothetical protein